jgi:hypothetical protein
VGVAVRVVRALERHQWGSGCHAGRYFVAVSLAEAESIRGCIHHLNQLAVTDADGKGVHQGGKRRKNAKLTRSSNNEHAAQRALASLRNVGVALRLVVGERTVLLDCTEAYKRVPVAAPVQQQEQLAAPPVHQQEQLARAWFRFMDSRTDFDHRSARTLAR